MPKPVIDIDIDRVRKETPGCKTKKHFNNAGTSLPPMPVVQTITDYLSSEAENGGYEWADRQAENSRGFYTSASRLLNVRPENIAFAFSATHAFTVALSCIPFAAGDKVVIADEDYASYQIALLALQKRHSIQLLRAPGHPEGGVDLDALKTLLDKRRPRLVAISHVPSHTGLIQPVQQIGALCRERDILYMVDACQSAGQMEIHAADMQCDFLCATLRKFLRGPRGAGLLYVSDRVLATPAAPFGLDMAGAEWSDSDSYRLKASALRFESWERSHALMQGAKSAIEYALMQGLHNIEARNAYLCNMVRSKLNAIGLASADRGKQKSSIISVPIPDKKEAETVAFLRSMDINTSSSSRVQAQIDLTRKKLHWTLRLSPHYFNTEEEIDELADALNKWMTC